MLKLRRKWRKKSLYKKLLTLFIILLIFFSIVFLTYVSRTMVEYENSLIDNYIKELATSGSLANDISIKNFEKNKYETSRENPSKGLKSLLKESNITVDKVTGKDNTYTVNANDAYIATVTLKKVGQEKKMAILTIDKWKVTDVKSDFEKGIYHYDINIPKNYKLIINGKELSDKDITKTSDVSGLDRMTSYVELCKSNYYEMNNFVSKPKIKILDDNNKEVNYKIKDNKIDITKEFKTYDSYESMKSELAGDIDVLKLAEDWSLFLTDDLSGLWHGFSGLSNYLIEDSYMYEMAYGWAHNVDITFVSSHTLSNPVFTNEYVKNCTLYNKNAFKCEVHLDKNMRVGGNEKIDTLHDNLYFVYYNGGFKLVDMKSIS